MQITNNPALRFENFIGKIHIIGIGGIGMSGIAEILHNLGYLVQGSDVNSNENIRRLEDFGVKIHIGHNENNVEGAGVVVTSSAVMDDNIEVQQARKLRIPIVKRSEMLAELMRLKTSIAISGSHGKTTTTSLIGNLFENAELKPTVISGGIINTCNTNAYLGEGNYLIAEADESDGTFIMVPSTIAVITSIDSEHINYYKSYENLKEAFTKFFKNLPFYGFGVACIDDDEVRKITEKITDKHILTYSIKDQNADVYAYDIKSENNGYIFSIKTSDSFTGERKNIDNIFLPMMGYHNILNALSGIVIGLMLGFSDDVIRNGYSNFQGVKRRFTQVGKYNSISIIDDYAHHPREIEATLSTALSIAKKDLGQKVIAVIQPHRYTRLQHLFSDFVNCIHNAEIVVVADVYAAGEEEIEGINSANLVSAMKSAYKDKIIQHAESEERIYSIIYKLANPGDLVLFMGAGNITKWAHNLADELELSDIKKMESDE